MAWDREKEKKAGKAMTIGSSIYGVIFSIVWCMIAAAMGAWFMLLFGIPFAGMMLYRLYVCLQYAKEDKKEPPQKETDPWERPAPQAPQANGNGFCPYCGAPAQEGFAYCPKCGRKL